MNKSILFGTILSVLILCSLIIYPIEASEILEIKENSPGIDNDFEKAFYNTVRRYFVFAILSEPANITDDWFAVDCYF